MPDIPQAVVLVPPISHETLHSRIIETFAAHAPVAYVASASPDVEPRRFGLGFYLEDGVAPTHEYHENHVRAVCENFDATLAHTTRVSDITVESNYSAEQSAWLYSVSLKAC